MKKFLLFLLCMSLAASTGCAQQKNNRDNTIDDSTAVGDKNPFEAEDNSSPDALSSISHSPTAVNLDENGKKLPFVYEGEEMVIPYQVKATGKAKNVGFLVFIDGVSQPYRTDSSLTYQTMHAFDITKEEEEFPFSIIFEPVTGKKGETLSLMIVSVYAPDFMPDMENTSGYGMYHNAFGSEYEILFNAQVSSPESSKLPKYKQLENVKQSVEPITLEYLESLSIYSGGVAPTLESLNKQIFTKQLFGQQEGLISNLKINDEGKLHVTFKIVGYPGSRYRHTFYINHQALADGEITSFETVLTKGSICVVEADIELSQLEEFNTFYVLSTLCNVQELWEDGTFLDKTASVLLYQKEGGKRK